MVVLLDHAQDVVWQIDNAVRLVQLLAEPAPNCRGGDRGFESFLPLHGEYLMMVAAGSSGLFCSEERDQPLSERSVERPILQKDLFD